MTEPKRRGRPPKAVPTQVLVRCTEKNVWTSAGKLEKGDTAHVSAEEAAILQRVEIVE